MAEIAVRQGPGYVPNVDAVAKKNQGNAAFKARDFPKAIALYSEGVRLDPSYHVLYSNRSQANFNAGDYVAAAKDGWSCTVANPEFVKGYHRCANAMLAQKKYMDCQSVLNTAYAVKSIGRGNADLGKIQELVSPEVAKIKARKSASLTGAAKTRDVANKAFKESDYDTAIKLYKKCIGQCQLPRDVDCYVKAYNNMTLCFKQQSDFKQMVESATAALSEENGNVNDRAKALFNRAGAFEGLEQYSHALADVRKVLSTHPGWEAANKAQNRLGNLVRQKKKMKAQGGR